jgi:hypothetical protein
MKTTKQKGKQIKTQKPNKKRQKDYNPDTGSTVQTRQIQKKYLGIEQSCYIYKYSQNCSCGHLD